MSELKLRPPKASTAKASSGEKAAERFLPPRPGAQKTVRKKKPGRYARNDGRRRTSTELAGCVEHGAGQLREAAAGEWRSANWN